MNKNLTGTAEGDGTGIETGSDGGRGLNMQDDEGGGFGMGGRRSKLDIIKRPPQGFHAFLAAIDGDDHTLQVSRHTSQVMLGR